MIIDELQHAIREAMQHFIVRHGGAKSQLSDKDRTHVDTIEALLLDTPHPVTLFKKLHQYCKTLSYLFVDFVPFAPQKSLKSFLLPVLKDPQFQVSHLYECYSAELHSRLEDVVEEMRQIGSYKTEIQRQRHTLHANQETIALLVHENKCYEQQVQLLSHRLSEGSKTPGNHKGKQKTDAITEELSWLKRLDRLEIKIAHQSQLLDALQADNDQLKEQLQTLFTENTVLSAENEALQAENSLYASEVKALQHQCQTRDREIARLKKLLCDAPSNPVTPATCKKSVSSVSFFENGGRRLLSINQGGQ